MKFFSRELSEKLQAMGCKSESGFRYTLKPDGDGHLVMTLSYWGWLLIPKGDSPAFYQNDFTGCHKQAWKNAKIAWDNPGDGDLGNNPDGPDIFRHNMIDSDDAEKFLEEFFS